MSLSPSWSDILSINILSIRPLFSLSNLIQQSKSLTFQRLLVGKDEERERETNFWLTFDAFAWIISSFQWISFLLLLFSASNNRTVHSSNSTSSHFPLWLTLFNSFPRLPLTLCCQISTFLCFLFSSKSPSHFPDNVRHFPWFAKAAFFVSFPSSLSLIPYDSCFVYEKRMRLEKEWKVWFERIETIGRRVPKRFKWVKEGIRRLCLKFWTRNEK